MLEEIEKLLADSAKARTPQHMADVDAALRMLAAAVDDLAKAKKK